VIAVAAGDERGVDALLGAIPGEGQERGIAVDPVDRDVARLEDDLEPARGSRVDQVAGDFGLAIDGDVSTSQRGDVDADDAVVGGEVEAVLDHALGVEALIDAEFVEQVGRDGLEHPGANAVVDMGAGLAFDDDAVDSRRAQLVPEQQPRRAGADDRDLGLHEASCFSSWSSTR
jgi:hypothetical protein